MILHMCSGVVDFDDPWANGVDGVLDVHECPVLHHWSDRTLDSFSTSVRMSSTLPTRVSSVVPPLFLVCGGPGVTWSLEVCT